MINPIWPTDGWWDVPMLDLELQATHVEAPFARWGRETRKSRMRGTWHFYTDDVRFEALWSRPDGVNRSGCVAAVECNFSVHDQTPRARVMWQTYRKRWLARYWQGHGVRILVDLNVSPEHAEMNMLGVPVGWRAYATRGAKSELDVLDQQLLMATTQAGTEDVLFVVYGGGRRVGDWCELRGAVWVREERDLVRESRRLPALRPVTGRHQEGSSDGS